MKLRNTPTPPFRSTQPDWVERARTHLEKMKYPGLTTAAGEIQKVAHGLLDELSVLTYKMSAPLLWVVFVGGTGTGKSTLFNAFCGEPLSDMGVERPKTLGPIVYAHKEGAIEDDFPFGAVELERRHSSDSTSTAATGEPRRLLILTHNRSEFSHLAITDTPDLDSVEPGNREIAQDLYLLADVVVFVTSQEKYADEIPFQLLARMREEEKPYFFLLNKADRSVTKDELTHNFKRQNIGLKQDRVFLIPYAPTHPYPWIAEHPEFRSFSDRLLRHFSKEKIDDFRDAQLSRRAARAKPQLEELIELLVSENQAGQNWLERLHALYKETAQELIRTQKERFAEQSRRYLQAEIRKLFRKYDLLAKPRRYVKKALLMPFTLLGLTGKADQKDHRQGLLRVREKINFTPVEMTVLKLNRRVLEELSPSDETSPLFVRLRGPSVQLQEAEIKHRILAAQDQLGGWLEETFQALSKGIPKTKQWGIYSTSALWGVLILSFEVTVGGGFTVLDAALDTALAPFVTKGAMELFAYQEIQKIARELAKRYQDGLLSVVRLQRDRYAACMRSLMTSDEDLESLRRLLS